MTNVDPVQRLILELSRLPGIGERSAARLAFYFIREAQTRSRPLALDLAQALTEAVERVGLCEECFNLSVGARCSTCDNPRRDGRVICVVESVSDLRAFEQVGVFGGRYHVLHGSLAPLEGVGPDDLKIEELLERVARVQPSEVILATNADVEGDATALYLTRLLTPLNVNVSRLASGIPLGGELEFVDRATLGRAFSERKTVS